MLLSTARTASSGAMACAGTLASGHARTRRARWASHALSTTNNASISSSARTCQPRTPYQCWISTTPPPSHHSSPHNAAPRPSGAHGADQARASGRPCRRQPLKMPATASSNVPT